MVRGDGLPEEPRRGAGRLAAGQLVQAREPDELGHLGVGVDIRQLVLAPFERPEHALVVQQLGHAQPAPLARARIQFSVTLVEPAVLAGQHLLHLGRRERCEHALEIAGQANSNGQRTAVIEDRVCIEQSRKQLVHGVQR